MHKEKSKAASVGPGGARRHSGPIDFDELRGAAGKTKKVDKILQGEGLSRFAPATGLRRFL